MRLRTCIASLALALAGTAAMAPPAPADVTVHWSEGDGISAGMSAGTSSSTAYRFATIVNGKPVRWNPCAAIHWKYNPSGQPTWTRADGTRLTGLNVVASAVKAVSEATGIRFKYDGTTSMVPSSKLLPTSVETIKPVVMGWTDARRSDLLSGQPASTLAVTRTAYFKKVVDGVTLTASKAMVIAFDRTNRLPAYGTQSWRSVALHEIAHGMGLSHVSTTSQIMYPMLQNKFRELQSGDRAGLYRLGRSQGCIDMGF